MTNNETNLETNILGGKVIKVESGNDVYMHRNGICGQPFWTIKFTYGNLNMIGTIGIEGDDLIASSCRVLWTGTTTTDNYGPVDVNVVQSCWRGDQFAPFLAKQLNEIFAGEAEASSLYSGITVNLLEA